MDHDDIVSNKSGNRPFQDVIETYSTRRDVLVGGSTVAATTFFAPSFAVAGSATNRKNNPLVNFTPVPLDRSNDSPEQQAAKEPRISEDYYYEVLIPWGTALQPGGPEYVGTGPRPTADEQANQIGIGHDGMWFFPDDADHRGMRFLNDSYDDRKFSNGFKIAGVPQRGSSKSGVLCINHEFGENPHVLDKPFPESLADVQTSQHAHGVSVVAIAEVNGSWERVYSQKNRRIHVNTPVEFSGPAKNSPLLRTPSGNAPRGTVNNCGNGYTPWGTYLTCEENFNGYFGWNDPGFVSTAEQGRYGFSREGFGYGWHVFDPRFDLSNPNYSNEENRFGWILEIDPSDPAKKPVKRTALGRFKHEGCAVAVGAGNRIVAYMGDDERFDYIYKFVSAGDYKKMLAQGKSPLDEGKLYVARFNDDGSGDWIELAISNPAIQAAGFTSQDEVLVYTRLAADAVGATPMDRPEWTTVTQSGECYCTLTNNSRRTVADAANPLAPNADGHIIRMKDNARFTGAKFRWDIFIIARNTHGTEASFSSPDGLWADNEGRLFIQTDGGQKDGLQDQLTVADVNMGTFSRLFEGVNADEITGIAITPDRRTLFINMQHPGDGDPSLTNFPAPTDGVTIPRDCTIVIRRKDGGIVGS